MKVWIETVKKIITSKEALKRLQFTIIAVLLYRFGSFVMLPGVDLFKVESSKGSTSGLFGLLDVFVGGAFSNISLLALGIMPYISSSIIVQLLTAVFPQLQKMRSEGESGSRKIAKITRYLAIAIAFVQASSYLGSYAKDYLTQQNTWTYFTALISLVAGAFFVIWLADRITEKGLGNGASVIMLAGILSRFPQAFMVNFLQRIGSIPLLVLEFQDI